MRKPLVVANWKMNKAVDEASEDAKAFAALAEEAASVAEVGLAPSTISLPAVKEAVHKSVLLRYAQDARAEDGGAFTGAVSLEQVRPFVHGTLVGHSERRHAFGESDELVASKAAAAVAKGMHAILCIGETKEERDAGSFEEVIGRQLKTALSAIRAALEDAKGSADGFLLDVAYEPVWAISGGDASVEPATTEEIQEAHAFVRETLGSVESGMGSVSRILYGGSVKPGNAREIFAIDGVDGALVGGASLDASSFAEIVRSVPSS